MYKMTKVIFTGESTIEIADKMKEFINKYSPMTIQWEGFTGEISRYQVISMSATSSTFSYGVHDTNSVVIRAYVVDGQINLPFEYYADDNILIMDLNGSLNYSKIGYHILFYNKQLFGYSEKGYYGSSGPVRSIEKFRYGDYEAYGETGNIAITKDLIGGKKIFAPYLDTKLNQAPNIYVSSVEPVNYRVSPIPIKTENGYFMRIVSAYDDRSIYYRIPD